MTEPEKQKEDQETVNVRKYGYVFRLCLTEAVAIGKDATWAGTNERILDIAKILFDRYWSTQDAAMCAGAKAAPPTGRAGE